MDSSPALMSPLRGLAEGWGAPITTRGSRPGLFHVAPAGLSGSGPLDLALPPLPGGCECVWERGRG